VIFWRDQKEVQVGVLYHHLMHTFTWGRKHNLSPKSVLSECCRAGEVHNY